MNEIKIIGKINELLYTATDLCCGWLNKMLPRISDNWWTNCVLDSLSFNQNQLAQEKGYTELKQLDLAALLRVIDKNWYAMRNFAYLPTKDRETVRRMMRVRNTWAHISGTLPSSTNIQEDLQVVEAFFYFIQASRQQLEAVEALLNSLDDLDASELSIEDASSLPTDSKGTIREKSKVRLTSDPSKIGMVFSVETFGPTHKYEVFIDGGINTFYDGQIQLIEDSSEVQWEKIEDFRNSLTAYEINNPSTSNLYSLNSAKIDFVPYQFRPALKLIKSDEPRILIADSVGVGKTIEAGLIIKELEARNELESILIICPKPLVTERKWETEMKRFDEEFTALDGDALRETLNDCNRDGEWPLRSKKIIVPYSILDDRTYNGTKQRLASNIGLKDLDPAPHFDLVIVDEAHHIRNGSMEKDKAFAYKCVKYFCDHASAVVMLTATPLQTSDNDLFTLLNLLRPDVVIDKATFRAMSEPNAYISKCSRLIRSAAPHWQENASSELIDLASTRWGENVVSKNPLYQDILKRLEKKKFTREERVQLISDVESLHSFGTMLNRTRRKDIQDFCVRHTNTFSTSFTEPQKMLYHELLRFEQIALSMLHNVSSVPFMMSTIKRQASSCIFGLAPHIKDILNQRLAQLCDDPEVDVESLNLDNSSVDALRNMSQNVLALAENLPDEDPKFDAMLDLVLEKQQEQNNKILVFSTFRYTLDYVERKLTGAGLRTAQINGSIKDEERVLLRARFELPREDPDALDILLFTEVGAEGLDYQFCNMMINYDLPWNPMKIEQRIGRIDRRGQQSEVVNICNLITEETVDAEIYSRCLLRIGVFERSVGDCEEILGDIGSKIEKIALDSLLTDEERKQKLEDIADNEVRKAQYLTQLEEEQRDLFGFDLTNYTISQEIQDAESPWLSAENIYSLVQQYLTARVGKACIFGDGEIKNLRLSAAARMTIREDYKRIAGQTSALKRHWDSYLKGTKPNLSITFSADAAKLSAEKNENVTLISAVHPLVRQAAEFFASRKCAYLSLRYQSDELPAGTYPFAVYAWQYVGISPKMRIIQVCENETIERELTDIFQNASSDASASGDFSARWKALEQKQMQYWTEARKKQIQDTQSIADYRIESLQSSLNVQQHAINEKIAATTDASIKTMRIAQLEAAQELCEKKIQKIEDAVRQTDLHVKLLANGIVEVRR